MSEAKNSEIENFKPYISAETNIAEVTIKAVVLGSILSVVFGVANAYIGLKYGMTVCASIPAAVISMAVLRALFKKVTVLENNIVQTIGSAGESLAAGIIFTIPAFFIWAANAELATQDLARHIFQADLIRNLAWGIIPGNIPKFASFFTWLKSADLSLLGYTHEISKTQIFCLSMLGGGLGILLMIPLRKYLVQKEHDKLAFPEGTACAEIIVAGDEGGKKAKTVFLGIGIGVIYKIMMYTARLWSESPSHDFKKFLKGGTIGIDATPVLLGVGYIIGPRIAALMLSGAVLGYLGIGPLLSFIGDQIPGVIISPGNIPLSDMDPSQLRNFYIKYLGVGAVAVGGFVSLAKSFPIIINSFAVGFRQLIGGRRKQQDIPRTDRDLPMSVVLIGTALIVFAIWIMPDTELHFMGAALAVLFGFFFVVVAARIVGIVGSSSSPVSGMTIATLLVTCLLLISFGVNGARGMITAMSVGAVVCIAVCMSGDIAQDLKTGFLLGGTPSKMQITEFIGLLFPAIAMGFTLYILKDAFGFQSAHNPDGLLAPQANVMATVVQGIMNANIPWAPIMVGGMIALAIELLGIQSLPFAIGLYLPLSLSTPIMAGGIMAHLIKKSSRDKILSVSRHQMGILFGSGIVAGDALIGVATAGIILNPWINYADFFNSHEGLLNSLTGGWGPFVSLAAFGGLMLIFYYVSRRFGSNRE
nr:oligopeptide transporter, OPT family [candidate division Zixibacteria bacterium]